MNFFVAFSCVDFFFFMFLKAGATNRPQELDPAVRRRMSNRLYIPLPEEGSS